MNANVKKVLAEIIRFGIIGVLATFVDWGIFRILSRYLGVYYILSSTHNYMPFTNIVLL